MTPSPRGAGPADTRLPRAYGVIPRVAAEQDFALPLLVTLMVLLYWVATCWYVVPYVHIATAGWRRVQQGFATVEVVVVLYCLWRCACTSPGRIPRGWNGSNQNPVDRGVRWCRACGEWKPARTHHCSTCNACVPRYDHHCLWVDNCVGEANHKFFLLFLFYVSLCCVHYFYTINRLMSAVGDGHAVRLLPLHDQGRGGRTSAQAVPVIPMMGFGGGGNSWLPGGADEDGGAMLTPRDMSTAATVGLVLYSLAAFGFFWFAACFFGCSCWGAVRNMTSYDEATAGDDDPVFDQGVWENLAEVLGRHPLLWLVPWENAVTLPAWRQPRGMAHWQ